MDLKQKTLMEIKQAITKVAQIAIGEAVALMIKQQKEKGKVDCYKKGTIKKLKSYPILKRNIEEYQKDLDDIYKEEFGKSPAVHVVQSYYNPEMTVDEIRYVESLKILKNKIRDEAVIKEVDRALNEIKNDYYYTIIPKFFFDKKTVERIAEEMGCDTVTIYRNKSRLLDILTIKLYGGDAIS